MNFKNWALPLLFLMGGIFSLAHAPFHQPILACLGLAGAAVLSLQTSHKLWAGYFFGVGFFLPVMSWITEPFALGPPELAWLAYPSWVAMAAGLALFWIPIFLFAHRGFWSIALVFGLMEYLRGHLFTGLPWALFAYGWQESILRDLASLMGAYGLSAFLALIVLLLAQYRKLWSLGLGVVLLFASISFHYLRKAPDDYDFAALKIRAVQPNFTIEDRWNNAPRVQLRTLIELSQSDADIVVWPEGSIFISPTREANLLPFIAQALPGKTVIFGAPSYDGDLYFNSAYEMRSGAESYRYDKIHLVPFGEYIPYGDWLLEHGIATQTVNTFNARKGARHPYPNWPAPEANILICYEGLFPKMARRGGDYIALITNDIWFGKRSGPYQHLAASRFRAIENGQPLIRSALTGISAIINAQGEIVAQLPLDVQGAIEAPMGPKYATTFYRHWGDWPFLIVSLLLGLVLVLRRLNARKKGKSV